MDCSKLFLSRDKVIRLDNFGQTEDKGKFLIGIDASCKDSFVLSINNKLSMRTTYPH